MRRVIWEGGIVQDSKVLPKPPDVGIVLMDMSYRPIAWDAGAAAILSDKSMRVRREAPSSLPVEVLNMIDGRKPSELLAAKLSFHLGTSEYNCRAYVTVPDNGFPAMVALNIERVSSVVDAVRAVAAKCHLTEREQEALKGVSRGLSSKELAQVMNISPNTVKVFLRLIMIKMGVTSRGGIVAQMLQYLADETVGADEDLDMPRRGPKSAPSQGSQVNSSAANKKRL